VGELAEKIKIQQRRLAERVMRANAQSMPRLDAVMHLSSALEAYRELDPAGQKQLLAEAGAVGQKGLSINNPEQIHHLQHYRGGTTVSALQVVCILYVGVQLLLPGQDAGIDFAREYELAKGMAGAGGDGARNGWCLMRTQGWGSGRSTRRRCGNEQGSACSLPQ
jgi:hypothetical protein